MTWAMEMGALVASLPGLWTVWSQCRDFAPAVGPVAGVFDFRAGVAR